MDPVPAGEGGDDRLLRASRVLGRFLVVILLTYLGLLAVTFFIGRVIPIDPVLAIVGDRAPEHVIARVREELGLNKPLWEQFYLYVSRILQGDFGTSVLTSNPVMQDIRRTFPATFELATLGIVIGAGFGVPLGVWAAVRRGGLVDQVVRVMGLIGYSIPIFWLGLMALVVFYARLGWVGGPGRIDVVYEYTLVPLTGLLLSERPRSRRQAAFGHAYGAWRTFSRNRLAMLGLLIVAGLVLTAVFADALSPYSPFIGDLRTTRLLPPSAAHWFGTDDQGRDILSRIIHGSRITLFVVVLVAVLAAPIGLAVGTVAGYAGGLLDAALMRVTDIFLAFPRLILALAFVAALGPGIENAVLTIAITSWPPYARIARAETLTIRQADYIAAVQLIGASRTRIVLRHIMPLCVSSVIVHVTLDMAGIILTAAGLGFLGLGAQPPMPESPCVRLT